MDRGSLAANVGRVPHDVDTALKERFGLDAFRPWQRDAISALLEGSRRVMVVAPTGGGKSLCYQLPATVLEGTTLVVSPLIALMDDQVRALRERGIAATYLASTLPREEVRDRENRLARGEYDLVYIAPERLSNPYVRRQLKNIQIPFVAIDEAHCISQWGHDFRPDYLRIGEVLKDLAPKHVLACTATATPRVRDEIVARLGIGQHGEEVTTVLRGFARPNLHLECREFEKKKDRVDAMLIAVRKALGSIASPKGAAIVYASTRKDTDKLTQAVKELGFRAAGYHAGHAPAARASVSEAFASGELDVIVATNAFGMGIDRADIRLVVHAATPGSIEAYYQEVGRAGRDGAEARGLLLTGTSDFGLRRRLIELPTRGEARSPERIKHQWNMFLDLMRYVEAGSCRHDFILRYFGDEAETLGGCGHCDVCARIEEEGEDDGTLSPEDLLIVRKALSGVARCHNRFGLRAVAEMLEGKTTKKLEKMRLTTLSTHGLLRERSGDWIMALLRRLITAGLVELSTGEYPLAMLTKRGAAVMKEEENIRFLMPRVARASSAPRAGKRAPLEIPVGPDRSLYDALKEKRLEMSREDRVPAYYICTDRTLIEIVKRKPRDEESLLRVPGMGPARVESWGDELLGILTEWSPA